MEMMMKMASKRMSVVKVVVYRIRPYVDRIVQNCTLYYATTVLIDYTLKKLQRVVRAGYFDYLWSTVRHLCHRK